MERKNITESLKTVTNCLEWLYTHNKNYTKEQYFKIEKCLDELKSLDVNNKNLI